MEDKPLLWEEVFKIRAYEAGHDGRAKLQALFNYLQEAAANHAARLKLSKTDLDSMGLTWVLSRFHLQVFRYPFWNQKVFVETWPSQKQGLFALRDFIIRDEQQRTVALATSSWMLIDFKARRPVRLPAFLEAYQNHEKGRALDDPFPHLPELKTAQNTKRFQVRLSDLDMNQHVNSTIYIDWALEAVPDHIRTAHQIQSLEINYRAEAVYGQRINSLVQIDQGTDEQIAIVHRLERDEDQRELARLVTRWQPK